jgi:hypothetical protein
MRRGRYIGNLIRSELRAAARLDETMALPSFMSLTRAACPASWQTGPAVNGTTFIAYNTNLAANTPRFHYVPLAGRRMVLVEPARLNTVRQSRILDAGPVDNVPDGWAPNGVAGVNFNTLNAGSPSGGGYLQLTTTPGRGCGANGDMRLALTSYACSVWSRRVEGTAAQTLYTIPTSPGFPEIAMGAAVHDWQRFSQVEAQVGATNGVYMIDRASGTDEEWLCFPQVEPGTTASTWIPTVGASATRAEEQCFLAVDSVPYTRGSIEFLWSPGFASTDALPGGWCDLFTLDLGVNEWVGYEEATGTLQWSNNGAGRTPYAMPAFNAWDVFHIGLHFGSFGTRMTVNGVVTDDPAAWVAVPPTDPGLGHHAIFQPTQAFGDLRMWGI